MLPHRMRKNPLDDGTMDTQILEQIMANKKENKEPENSKEGD